jgi:cysteine desulfuration protein SufE
VQDRQPTEVAATDIRALLEPFNLTRELSSNRTQGVPNMIALVRDTAARLAAA